MIHLKTPPEIEVMAEAGHRLALIFTEVKKAVKPGVTAKELDELAESLISKFQGISSFKNYGPGGAKKFPACLCVSFNDEVVHGIPINRAIKKGDVLSLDLGFYYQGFHSDMAETIAIGEVPQAVTNLIKATNTALWQAIKEVKVGRRLGDLGFIIEQCAYNNGFSVISELCGHGIGHQLHEEPEICNFGRMNRGLKLVEGMVFCIEPMFCCGSGNIKLAANGLTFKTADRSISAHFEHMVAVTKNGGRILTML